MVPLLRERAVAADRDRRIEADTYRRLGDAGFFHILKPKRYGGLELSEHEHAKAVMTLARGCASTAWVFSILSSDNMAVLAYPEEVQDEIWGTDTYATLAGNTNLNPRTRAMQIAGGYRLTGQWGFCSGSDFSEWLIFNAPAGDTGEGHMFLVPRRTPPRSMTGTRPACAGPGAGRWPSRTCSFPATASRRPATPCRSSRNAVRCTRPSPPCRRTGPPPAGSRSPRSPSGPPGGRPSTSRRLPERAPG